MKRQQGAALIVTLLIIVLVIMALVTLLKLIPIYQDDWAAGSVFESLLEEVKAEDLTRQEVQRRITRRFDINNINELSQHVKVEGQGSVIRVGMNYERRVPLAANIELVATFSHNVILSE